MQSSTTLSALTDFDTLAESGPPPPRLTDSGIDQMIERRSREAGITPIHPHQFRHTYAHLFLFVSSGSGETDLQRLRGVAFAAMVSGYASSARAEPAPAAHRHLLAGEDI